jgi:glycosyltransferase involved in cell wall biosynthesis
MDRKLSFLIAAHNEEKIIRKTLQNLLNLPYENYEVVVGLDGCTDGTEEIVKEFCKKSDKFRYYKLNLRQGKPAVINSIIKKANGEIIIINDADWIFKVENNESLKKFLVVFDDPKIGGIAESFPIQYPLSGKGILESGVGIQTAMWMNYVKNKSEKRYGDWLRLTALSFPMLVNIFKVEDYIENSTLGDDFERFIHICSRGKIVLATNNPDYPRMTTIGENYTLYGIFKQKERTALARKQIGKAVENKLGPGFVMFVLKEIPRMKFKVLCGFILVNIIFGLATFKSKFRKEKSTKEGWKMRLKR